MKNDIKIEQTLNALLAERFDGKPEYLAQSIDNALRFFILNIELSELENQSLQFKNSFEVLFLLRDTFTLKQVA